MSTRKCQGQEEDQEEEEEEEEDFIEKRGDDIGTPAG